MDERAIISRLHRRLGFGLIGGELPAALTRGVAAERARIVDRSGAPADPFGGADLTFEINTNKKKAVAAGAAWVSAMVESSAPLVERAAWTWHGIIVSSVAKVRSADMMATQIQLFRRAGLDGYGALLDAISRDQAMLLYLDGAESTGAHPNENYSRELLELFSLGVGAYTEADIDGGAKAMTGWTVAAPKRNPTAATFEAKRHDAALQPYLDTKVNDISSVVAAILARPELATYIAKRFTRDILGPNVPAADAAAIAERFRASGLSVLALAESAGDLLSSPTNLQPVVSAPVPWLVMAQRATGARLKAEGYANVYRLLGAAGQVPLNPPNVGGWPSGRAWTSSATVVARANLASVVSGATPPDSLALAAAGAGDWSALALALGLPGDFGPATVAGLSSVRDGFARLALALVSPEFVEV
jgi:uncharacterized protein (DUF1800 family)